MFGWFENDKSKWGFVFYWKDWSFLLFGWFQEDSSDFFKAAIARLEALENDYTGMETVEAVLDVIWGFSWWW
jgi:hypothetical protein